MSNLLSRMAGADGAGPDAADPPVRSALANHLATAVLRVADAVPGLGLAIETREVCRRAAAEAFDNLDDRALCLLLDPPDHDPNARHAPAPEALAARTGLIALHPAMTDALVEVQTIGHVDGPGRPPRRPTRIDAALAQPFVGAVLTELSALVPGESPDPRHGGLRPGSFVAGPASLGLILTAVSYLRVDLILRLGDGMREGRMSLLLPNDAAPLPDPGQDIEAGGEWAADMRAAALDAPVRLEAVLPPMRLPLSRLVAMKPGDLIPLDANALGRLVLHGGSSGLTMPGRKRLPRGATMTARLGQLNGARAIKITTLPGEPVMECAPPASEEGPAQLSDGSEAGADAGAGLPDLATSDAPAGG
ncbi:FliM/FliN family flagellar motor switch protein [Jannaschia sp. S6380]|uniref:FliM/FliN family flagellar motor switch protein n=1 Tax=Jannaschia sp. S6380 TaxID=2926408 RepID=UPI001FF1DCB8|nr:FliM/FliN family flagellar motor switch protein [Jannaschia sp. S6380]MCK0167467.1 FliM/FliN family flagellar motor switch protein [Jannaschia sp. S6380]